MLYCPESSKTDHLISTFGFIGFSDLTFDKEYRKPVESEVDEHDEPAPCLKYPEYKYEYKVSPMCIYIPSDLLLLKMMRACCYVTQVEDLVYYIDSCCDLHSGSVF